MPRLTIIESILIYLPPYLRVFINMYLECVLIYLGVGKFGCSVCALHQPKVGWRKFYFKYTFYDPKLNGGMEFGFGKQSSKTTVK